MRAIDWISKNLRCADNLTVDALSEINDFTLLWGLFEGVECEGDARKSRFETYARQYSGKVNLKDLDNAISYWRNRYSKNGKETSEYHGLKLRHSDASEYVTKVIFQNENSSYDLVVALLTIIHRLRNNLFHGLKTIDMLASQIDNFKHANQVLITLMPVSGKYIYLDVAA